MRILGLTLVLVGLAILWYRQINDPTPVAVPDNPPAAAVWDPTPTRGPDPDDLAVILERPLFVPQRAPAIPVRADPEPVPPPRVRLSAVSVSNQIRVAVIQNLDDNTTRHVRQGDLIGDWLVEKVEEDKVILRANDQIKTILLFGNE